VKSASRRQEHFTPRTRTTPNLGRGCHCLDFCGLQEPADFWFGIRTLLPQNSAPISDGHSSQVTACRTSVGGNEIHPRDIGNHMVVVRQSRKIPLSSQNVSGRGNGNSGASLFRRTQTQSPAPCQPPSHKIPSLREDFPDIDASDDPAKLLPLKVSLLPRLRRVGKGQ
jgi:hypothetical protein